MTARTVWSSSQAANTAEPPILPKGRPQGRQEGKRVLPPAFVGALGGSTSASGRLGSRDRGMVWCEESRTGQSFAGSRAMQKFWHIPVYPRPRRITATSLPVWDEHDTNERTMI